MMDVMSHFAAAFSAALPAAGEGAPGSGINRTGSGPTWGLLIVVLPLLACLLCGLCAAFKVKTKLPALLTVACLAGSFFATVMLWIAYREAPTGTAWIIHGFDWIDVKWGGGKGQHLVANFGLYVDSLTCLWMLFVTGLGTLIALYASEYMEHDVGQGYNRFFAAFSLFVFMMSCLVMADNLVMLYLGWEGVGLCSYLLIGYFYKRPSAVAAAKKAFIVNRIGDLGLALGIMLCFVHFGSVEYKEIFRLAEPYVALVREGRISEIPAMVQLIPILLMIGAFGKSAQLPLYVWLPDAMEGPTPVSALIHAATMVTAGVFLVARAYPLFLCSEYALPIVAWVGALTALLAATIGMAQFDIKRIMAYSTVSQLGYMFAGLGVLTSTGAAFHVLTHAFFKALLFLSCGAVMHGFAGQLDLRKLSGLFRLPGWKIVSVGMLVGCLNLAGFPFTAGFFSKDMILAEAFVTPGFSMVGWILLLTAGLTAYYTFRVFFRVFVGPVSYEPGDEAHGHEDHDHGKDDHGAAKHEFHPHAPKIAINAVLAVLAVSSIVAAVLYFMGSGGGWAAAMVGHSTAHHDPGAHGEAHGTFLGFDPHKAMYFVSSVVGLLGIGAAFYLHYLGRTSAATSRADSLVPKLGAVAGWARNKWYVDEFYDFLIRKPLLAIAHICHWIDKLVVDGLVDAAGWAPKALGRSARPSQSGVLHGYAVGMAGGLAVVLIIVLLATM